MRGKPRGGTIRMNILVTGGGTVARIDDVREIANRSSGLFSALISEAFIELGAHVRHLAASRALCPFKRMAVLDLTQPTPRDELDRLARLHAQVHSVGDRLKTIVLESDSVREYSDRLRQALAEEPTDIAVLGMAVSDYEPTPVAGKLESRGPELVIRCQPAPKVIRSVRGWSPRTFLVGFKLLSNVDDAALVAAARRLIEESDADLVVAHDLKHVHTRDHKLFLVDRSGGVACLGPRDGLALALARAIKSEFARARTG